MQSAILKKKKALGILSKLDFWEHKFCENMD